jgi:hypothetical protein
MAGLRCGRRPSQKVLELGEDLLDWVHDGGVVAQHEQPATSGTNRFADGQVSVTAKVIHDHQITGCGVGTTVLSAFAPRF